jgi:hypothetical protein
MKGVGIRVYYTSSSPTTIAIKGVGKWHRSQCNRDVGTQPRYVGMRLENRRVFWPDILQAERQVRMVRENLQVA